MADESSAAPQADGPPAHKRRASGDTSPVSAPSLSKVVTPHADELAPTMRIEKRDRLALRTRDVAKYSSVINSTILILGGKVRGKVQEVTPDVAGAKNGPGTIFLTQLQDAKEQSLVFYEVVEGATTPFQEGQVYRFGSGFNDRVRLVCIHGNSLLGVVDHSTRGKKPAIKIPTASMTTPQDRDRWVPVAKSKLANDRAAVANAMAKLASAPDASVQLVSFMEVLTRGGRQYEVGMKIQRRLEPTKELLTATVMAVHPETVHFSEFSDAEGRPLVCFKATHPHLYLSGQNYKSTALIKEFPGGSSHDGFHVEYRGYTGQYIFGVPAHQSPPPYGCANGSETINERELTSRRRNNEDRIKVHSRDVRRYHVGQVISHPKVMVQDTAVSDIKLQATIRKIDQDESDASSPFAGFIHLGNFQHVREYGSSEGKSLLFYHSSHPTTFARGKTYMSASLGRTFEFLCHDSKGYVFGYANDHLHNSGVRSSTEILASPKPKPSTPGVEDGGYNPEQGTVPMGTAVKITRDQMVQLKKVLREENNPITIRQLLLRLKLLPVDQPHWNENPPKSRTSFGYYGTSVIEFAALHELPSLPALQQWKYY